MEFAELIERPIVVLALAVSLLVAYAIFFKSRDDSARVPWAETSIPFFGGVVGYGEDPVRFLVEQRKKVGDVFRVNLLVMKITFVIGSKVSV
jgi:sterol 14-demethylase